MVPSFSGFSIIYCAIFLGIALFPIINMKEITFLIKISSKGIFFVSFLLLFVYFTGIKSFINTDFDYEYIKNVGSAPSHISLFGDDPSKLAGALSLGYFTHTIIIPVVKNNEDPKNNKRDLFLGYLLVFITYTTIGIVGYFGFSGSSFYDYYAKGKQFSQVFFSFYF
jgi:Na+/proline symporter